MDLSNANLSALPASIKRPAYDRTTLTPGIVHIGLGNFHRAHQSWYLHRLMQMGRDHDWAIIGAGVREFDGKQRDLLLKQDCLTTLIELTPEGQTAEITGSMIDYLPVEPGNGPLIEKLADPAIRIVSLTVTESGYFQDQVTKAFNRADPEIIHDAQNPNKPKTAFGAIVAALAKRRASGTGPMTAMSCDNLQGNGAILRQTVVGLAKLSDPDLAAWIEAQCSFPNSMVDCIVPATKEREHALVKEFGINDAVPVTHERFRQWVIEDDFCAGRPAWEEMGATFSDAVHAYERMKICMLNAGHQILANAGEVMGLETIADTMAEPLIGGLFRRVLADEIAPQVEPVPGKTPLEYLELISERFANPAIIDTVRRVAFDGSGRHTGFLLPTINERLAEGLTVTGLALVEALWARMCTGIRDDGSTIEANDPKWNALIAAGRAAKTQPRLWLEQRGMYGDLGDDPRFAQPFANWLAMLHKAGTAATLTHYLEQ